jgi:hypothetical protein
MHLTQHRQYVGIIEEQKQQILTASGRTGNASRGKNVLRTSKKMSMTTTDHINQQAVAYYVREAIYLARKQDDSKELE